MSEHNLPILITGANQLNVHRSRRCHVVIDVEKALEEPKRENATPATSRRKKKATAQPNGTISSNSLPPRIIST